MDYAVALRLSTELYLDVEKTNYCHFLVAQCSQLRTLSARPLSVRPRKVGFDLWRFVARVGSWCADCGEVTL
jgi:hypothetical protein